MPALTKFYEGAILPWHFGGPHEFTIGEANEYRRRMNRAIAEQTKQAKGKPTGRGRRR